MWISERKEKELLSFPVICQSLNRIATTAVHITNSCSMQNIRKKILLQLKKTYPPLVGAAAEYILHLPSVHIGKGATNPITHERNWTIKMK